MKEKNNGIFSDDEWKRGSVDNPALDIKKALRSDSPTRGGALKGGHVPGIPLYTGMGPVFQYHGGGQC